MTKEVLFAGGTLPIGSFKMRVFITYAILYYQKKLTAFHTFLLIFVMLENADLTNNIEEVFCRLPLPYVNEEFNIDSTIRNFTAIVCKPPSYTHIRRSILKGLSMSCSKSCHCSDLCSNKPFRKDKKIKIVKSEGCGWGAVALEPLEKGDFIIEYVGEVINDATCEQRLWDMKRRGDKNFYMCEISKDFTIDATFKGNTSRFLNHSCDPNCKLEKWQVEGETRVGVFASRFIEVGEPLTYDYREYIIAIWRGNEYIALSGLLQSALAADEFVTFVVKLVTF
ncbi:Histone-lysine N-methyltransferase ASHR3 [Triticum urartu]|uniref:Histone-lysine N-methyltransferase ASHR3 n=1 Tax=Triticum urartu TaxID=4572 RepID=M8APG1_TRIUA|nr:Histone-lysine N-methyltransferase ASHR3 [Triticum urartu]